MTDRRSQGQLETAVMAIVAAAGAPIAVAAVQRQLPGSPAYTTVMTTMSRLADKGALQRSKDCRAYTYQLAAPLDAVDDAVTATRMRRLLTDGSDRAGVLARFVAQLDDEEGRMLANLLERSEHRPAQA